MHFSYNIFKYYKLRYAYFVQTYDIRTAYLITLPGIRP